MTYHVGDIVGGRKVFGVRAAAKGVFLMFDSPAAPWTPAPAEPPGAPAPKPALLDALDALEAETPFDPEAPTAP